LDGLAITDHNSLQGYLKAKELHTDLLIIPGYEVETDAGHILVLGLEKLPPRTKQIKYEKLVNWVRDEGGVTIIVHPAISRIHLGKWSCFPPDALEVLNAAYPLRYFVKRGLRISKRLGVPGVAGSDSHLPYTVGDAYTLVETKNLSLVEVLKAIKVGSVRFEGDLSSFGSRFPIGLRYLRHKIS
jgi:predicted metal-dependent phosphoesterase TrpH